MNTFNECPLLRYLLCKSTQIITHFLLALLSPLFIKVFPPPIVVLFNYPIYFTLGTSEVENLPSSLIYLVLGSMKPLELVVNSDVFCKAFIFFVLSKLSFLIFNFLLDPGLAFISGKKDYDDFIKDSEVF